MATPREPRFKGPDADWHLDTEAGRQKAADRYMQAAAAAGLDALVLADHNSVGWVDIMVEAGQRNGVVVFPGFEVTTASGSDGAHLVIFGDPARSADDLRPLLHGPCGFSTDHPPFEPGRPDNPAPSPNTLPQILDKLPDEFLAIAPHVFTDNGLASGNTIEGSLRWKALHHDRLGAVDVGDGADLADASSFRARFIRRELKNFPCLKTLPFVSTSDAYSLDELGSHYTWIRMAKPTLEGIRQAFLDYDARIICDWDERYRDGHQTPNNVTHAWVEKITVTGSVTGSRPVTVALDQHLTVLIGGRGAGKSTMVNALRSLYGDAAGLPSQARQEAEQFERAIFADATLSTTHHLPHSGEIQTASWTANTGSRTEHGGEDTPTDFRMRVISQKELFERAANSPDNPHATSRNLLVLVDDALAAANPGTGTRDDFEAQLDEARSTWVGAARKLEAERAAVAQRPQIRQRVAELARQVAAFDDEASQLRRARNDQRLAEAQWFDSAVQEIELAIDALVTRADEVLPAPGALPVTDSVSVAAPADFGDLAGQLNTVRAKLRADVKAATETAARSLTVASEQRTSSEWQAQVVAAADDSEAYLQELSALGLDPAAYEQVRDQLHQQTRALADLDRRSEQVPSLETATNTAWQALEQLHEQRHERRETLLAEIAQRSGILRFTLQPATDTSSWTVKVRELLGLRSDGFLEDVPTLAEWLWARVAEHDDRVQLWREACVTGDFGEIARQVPLRAVWATRLRGLDPLVRTRLAAEIADETVTMEFRRDTSDQAEQWVPLTAGSPGQRSAAMLSFVLHHGTEPLVLDQPEDDLDTEWITQLIVTQLRSSRWTRQLVVVTHNANIPVNADAERVVVLENKGDGVRVRTTRTSDSGTVEHCGALEDKHVRADIQTIMEGGVEAFVRRERRYNNELNTYRAALQSPRT
ncbi:hypothetical protein FG385_32300 [Amycolatopsis alkalitolerans]|uniref:Uncharacterized protein n=1 Tax=Amycolatopsis alkalitolerans TaxID=2547244 RepID=A0A5C4LPZ2_9PSEU|nr:ATP-binding protein [Amycolatopsis alkalitolerans]TNC19420.1 hypothetical protein FG385_32300 [Amycolatopsis alkalitolerans]